VSADDPQRPGPLCPGVFVALLVGAGTAAPALAAAGGVDETKFGLMAHDIGLGDHHVEPGIDVNAELLFVSPTLFQAIGSPRPHFGVSVNAAGATSYAYGGLTWTVALGERGFLGLAAGGAIHDGKVEGEVEANRKRLGSRVLFHAGIELGYRLTSTVSLSILLDHMSNANLAPRNGGLTNIGLRTGLRF